MPLKTLRKKNYKSKKNKNKNKRNIKSNKRRNRVKKKTNKQYGKGLPENWTETVQDGKTYYYNKITKNILEYSY